MSGDISQAGALLRKLRIERGWRQEDLAAHAGLKQSVISELETGATAMTVYYARKMALAMGIPPAIIVKQMGLIEEVDEESETSLAALQSEYPTLIAMLARLRTLSPPAQDRVIAALRTWMDVETASQERVDETRKRLTGKGSPT